MLTSQRTTHMYYSIIIMQFVWFFEMSALKLVATYVYSNFTLVCQKLLMHGGECLTVSINCTNIQIRAHSVSLVLLSNEFS